MYSEHNYTYAAFKVHEFYYNKWFCLERVPVEGIHITVVYKDNCNGFEPELEKKINKLKKYKNRVLIIGEPDIFNGKQIFHVYPRSVETEKEITQVAKHSWRKDIENQYDYNMHITIPSGFDFNKNKRYILGDLYIKTKEYKY